MLSLFKDIDRMTNVMFNDPAEFSPAYDVEETDDAYMLTFDVPGIARKDLDLEIQGNRLAVSGERKTGERKRRFQLFFTLPAGVDAEAVNAQHQDGVLTLTIAKPTSARAKKITIGDQPSKGGFMKNLIGEKKAEQPASSH